MHVILDRQHIGKPSPHHLDRGVEFDRDGDGVNDSQEANVTPLYIDAARQMLEAKGHSVTVLQEGSYPERHQMAVELAKSLPLPQRPAAYVACHLNSGVGGTYGLVVHDYRSQAGRSMATRVQKSLRDAFTPSEIKSVKMDFGCPESPSQPARWLNCYNTIRGIYAGPAHVAGICFEPVFVQAHRPLLDDFGLRRIGHALAQGLMEWGTSTSTKMGVDGFGKEPMFDDGELINPLQVRDPRWDPREGDIVMPGPERQGRRVLATLDGQVFYESWPFPSPEQVEGLEEWRMACQGGVIVDGTAWTPVAGQN